MQFLAFLPIKSPNIFQKESGVLHSFFRSPNYQFEGVTNESKQKVQRVRKCVCYSDIGKVFKVVLIQRTLFVNNNTIEIQILTFSCQERNDDLVSKYCTLHTHSQTIKKMTHTTHTHLMYCYDMLVCFIQNQYFKYLSIP